MANQYEAIPSTGVHRGGQVEAVVTTSVRAQEATDPMRARRDRPAPPKAPATDGRRPARKGKEQ